MAKFNVLVSVEMKVHIKVEANSEDDAKSIVENMNDSQILKGEVIDVSTINIVDSYKIE